MDIYKDLEIVQVSNANTNINAKFSSDVDIGNL